MENFKKLSSHLSSFSRIQKQFILLIFDFLILDLGLFLSFILRLENSGGTVHEHGLAASQLKRIKDITKLYFI